jgi:hypothetical protein
VRRGRPCKTDIVSGVEASELQLLGQMETSTTATGRFRRGGERERERAKHRKYEDGYHPFRCKSSSNCKGRTDACAGGRISHSLG